MFCEKQGAEAAGQTVNFHCVPAGAMALFEGIETPENDPELLRKPEDTEGVNGAPFQVNGGSTPPGENSIRYVPLFQVCPPESVITPETVVDCPKAENAESRKQSHMRTRNAARFITWPSSEFWRTSCQEIPRMVSTSILEIRQESSQFPLLSGVHHGREHVDASQHLHRLDGQNRIGPLASV